MNDGVDTAPGSGLTAAAKRKPGNGSLRRIDIAPWPMGNLG